MEIFQFFSSIKTLILIFAVMANILLAILVLRSNIKSATNIIFILFNFTTIGWLIAAHAYSLLSATSVFALLLTRLSLFFAVPMCMLLFLFAHTFPFNKIQLKKTIFDLFIFFTIILMLLMLSPYTFIGVAAAQNSPKPLFSFIILSLFISFIIIFSMLTVYTLIRKFLTFKGVERRQAYIILWGIFLLVGLIITTVSIPAIFFGITSFVFLVPLYTLVFVGAATYAIVKHHMFNIEIITTEILVILLWAILFSKILIVGQVKGKASDIVIFVMTIIFGIFLIRSVKREIMQREELSSLAASLQVANTRLKELDQQKTDFLSIAAHQLRTPLSILNGYLELMREKAYKKEELAEVYSNMEASNQRLVKLIDEFLDITRIEQGRTKYDFVEKDIREIIDSVIEEFTERLEQKGLKITWHRPPEALKANLDTEKIRHVVFNFVDNAAKYSEKGTITIETAAEDDGLAVRVKDHGIGFNKTDQSNLFQKFYRGENVKHIDVSGTGLGLYVCSKFIEGHKGRIWGKSEGLGKGSEFGFWIPYVTNQ